MVFDEIRLNIALAMHGKYFALGDLIIERCGPWPMGDSLSEPAIMVDLNHEVWRCSGSATQQLARDWYISSRNVPLQHHVVGSLHVDDTSLGSIFWRTTCMEQKALRMFPADPGFRVEETGHCLKALNASVAVTPAPSSSSHHRVKNPVRLWTGKTYSPF